MLTVTFRDATYEFILDEQLKSLTGTESMLVEEFLGGWDKFDGEANTTRSSIVILWLALRSAGETQTLEQIAETPGLPFGDAFQLVNSSESEPEDPMVDPGRPLASRNGSNGSTDGTNGSAATAETSANTGTPLLPESIPA